MLDRIFSFIRSKNKQAILHYHLYELKAGAREAAGRMLHTERPRGNPQGRISLEGQTGRMYGFHRSGWRFAVDCLQELHNSGGVLADTFIDRTFASDAKRMIVYRRPWIGFIHVPPHVPDWIRCTQTNDLIFTSESWQESKPYCLGLFTLSEYHRQALEPRVGVPVESLMHPTEFPDVVWSWDRFLRNRDRKVVQTGWWLRRATTLYHLEAPGYRKVMLRKKDVDAAQHLAAEKEHLFGGRPLTDLQMKSVSLEGYLSNRKYDELMSENIVFLDLIDASANNAIIECIARNTPVLVNPLPAVREYLGAGYPLYYRSPGEASEKLQNMELVREAHEYLAHASIKERLTAEGFRSSFTGSAIYRSL